MAVFLLSVSHQAPCFHCVSTFPRCAGHNSHNGVAEGKEGAQFLHKFVNNSFFLFNQEFCRLSLLNINRVSIFQQTDKIKLLIVVKLEKRRGRPSQ